MSMNVINSNARLVFSSMSRTMFFFVYIMLLFDPFYRYGNINLWWCQGIVIMIMAVVLMTVVVLRIEIIMIFAKNHDNGNDNGIGNDKSQY